jgi:hypothetical protein
MTVRQVELIEGDDQVLEHESQRTGLSVSELVHQAVQQCYGAAPRRAPGEIVFPSVRANSATRDPWVYDPLFDDEWLAEDGSSVEETGA